MNRSRSFYLTLQQQEHIFTRSFAVCLSHVLILRLRALFSLERSPHCANSLQRMGNITVLFLRKRNKNGKGSAHMVFELSKKCPKSRNSARITGWECYKTQKTLSVFTLSPLSAWCPGKFLPWKPFFFVWFMLTLAIIFLLQLPSMLLKLLRLHTNADFGIQVFSVLSFILTAEISHVCFSKCWQCKWWACCARNSSLV